jgi:HEPN domain-containing protein
MKLHETWLLKANNDLRSSKKLMKGEDTVLDTAIYHTQQCAEKALKAYLAYKQHPIEKTHDVEYLIELCSEYDPEFGNLIEESETLNPYSTFFRYPGPVLEPEKDDVYEAIKIAERILTSVTEKINILERDKEAQENPEEENENNI